MLVETLLDTKINVSYRFMVLGDENGGEGERTDATRGQRNGLCGAALPGELHLITGLHTGDVGIRIELHSDEPPLGAEWDDAVEASFATTSEELALTSFDDRRGPIDLPPGTYRVRYCARGLQQGHDLDILGLDAEPVDHYLLQFWPGAGAERILRQSGEAAAYWHREGIDPPFSADELTARVGELRADRAERLAEEAAGEENDWWDGNVPEDDRLRSAGSSAAQLQQLDPALLAALADADDDLRRAVTTWVAEQELREAGLADLPWASAALHALRHGRPLPHRGGIYPDLEPMPIAPGFGSDRGARQHLAVEELYNAEADPDTLGAACSIVAHAGWGDHDLLIRLRRAFPQL